MADGRAEPVHWAQPNQHSTTSVAVDSTGSTDGGRAAKPARKRSRASRRAPTTLLNTDPSNFRAMVQHFTGVSSAPDTRGGPSTTSFGLDNPIQQTTAVFPSFELHQQQFDIFEPPPQQQEIKDGFAMNYENRENEILHGIYNTRADKLPEFLEGFYFDGIAGGMSPATEYGQSDGYFL